MAAPQNHPSYFILDNPNFQIQRPANDASINHLLFLAGNQFLLAQHQPHHPPNQQNQPQTAQPQQLLQAPLTFGNLPVVILQQIVAHVFNDRPVQIVNPWFFQWLPGANRTNIHAPTVPIPKTYTTFKNSGIRLRVPTDIRAIAYSRPIFNALLPTYGRHKAVIIENCHLSQLVSSVSHHRLFQHILRMLLNRTRNMTIRTGRYHRLESRITDFSRYCGSVRNIRIQCQRGCKWVENVAQERRVHQHLSYAWLPHGYLVNISAGQSVHFRQTNTWPAGLEPTFRRYMYATAEWRNAQRLVQAILRKRQRSNDRQPIQTTFEIQLMVMRANHANAFLQYSGQGGFEVLVGSACLVGQLFRFVFTRADAY